MVAKKARKPQITQKMVGFGTAIKNFWLKYCTFSGVASRREYWFPVLFVFLLELCLVMMFMINNATLWLVCLGLLLILFFATFVPFLSLAARRLHDIGVSAKWLWLLLIPGGAFLLYLYFLPTAMAASILYPTPANDIYILRCEWAFRAFLILSVPMFLAFLLPSKLKNNRYRKQA